MSKSPIRSTRRYATELESNQRTVRRILHKNLRLNPYKMAIVQELNTGDYVQKVDFTENMLDIFKDTK